MKSFREYNILLLINNKKGFEMSGESDESYYLTPDAIKSDLISLTTYSLNNLSISRYMNAYDDLSHHGPKQLSATNA